MNFISHFFLDRHLVNSTFFVGTATPDLLSIFNPRFRIKWSHIRRLETEGFNKAELALYKGVYRHFIADKVFHSSPHFTEETLFLSDLLKQQLPADSVHRKPHLAHWMLELILDKVLIQKHPEILDQYYNHFAVVSPFEEIRQITEKITGSSLQNYESYLNKFLLNRYLENYTDWDHIKYVLERIMRRVNIEQRAFLTLPEFDQLMREYESRLEEKYEVFFNEIPPLSDALP